MTVSVKLDADLEIIHDRKFPETNAVVWYTDNNIFCSTRREESLLSNDEIIEDEFVQILVEYLRVKQHGSLWIEAALTLVKMTARTVRDLDSVVRAGACPVFIELLGSEDIRVVHLAVRALENIASGGQHLRDMLIELSVLPRLTHLATRDVYADLLWIIVKCFRKLVGDTTALGYPDVVAACLPLIRRFLIHEHRGVVMEACFWIADFGDTMRNSHIRQAVDLGIVRILVEIINSGHGCHFLTAAVSALQCINDVQAVRKHGAIPAYKRLLERKVRVNDPRLITSVLASLAEEDSEWLQEVISADLVPILVNILRSGNPKLMEEATFTMFKLLCASNNDQVLVFVKHGVLALLVNILNTSSQEEFTALVALEAVVKIGRAYRKSLKPYWLPLKSCNLVTAATNMKGRLLLLEKLSSQMASKYRRLKKKEQGVKILNFYKLRNG